MRALGVQLKTKSWGGEHDHPQNEQLTGKMAKSIKPKNSNQLGGVCEQPLGYRTGKYATGNDLNVLLTSREQGYIKGTSGKKVQGWGVLFRQLCKKRQRRTNGSLKTGKEKSLTYNRHHQRGRRESSGSGNLEFVGPEKAGRRSLNDRSQINMSDSGGILSYCGKEGKIEQRGIARQDQPLHSRETHGLEGKRRSHKNSEDIQGPGKGERENG